MPSRILQVRTACVWTTRSISEHVRRCDSPAVCWTCEQTDVEKTPGPILQSVCERGFWLLGSYVLEKPRCWGGGGGCCQRCWRTEKCGWGEVWRKKEKKWVSFFFSSRNRLRKTSCKTFQAQQEVNSLLSRGTQEINRHHQHIPTLAPTHRKEFGHYVAMGDWFTFWPDACWWSKHCGSFLESIQELKCLRGLVCVSITVPAWGSSLLL